MVGIDDGLRLLLPDLEATAALGSAMARTMLHCNPGAVLLYGDLGAGKTTLTRAIVASLPGGDRAEISSPSFTICNIYSTQPLVHHYDLYRLSQGQSEESLGESLDAEDVITMVEWPENLSLRDMPEDGVMVRLMPDQSTENGRTAELYPLGCKGECFLKLLQTLGGSKITVSSSNS